MDLWPKVLVCGGRTYEDEAFVFRTLDAFHVKWNFQSLISGGSGSRHEFKHRITGAVRVKIYGADLLAEEWAKLRGVPIRRYDPDWKKHGKLAGFVRNLEMLEKERPSIVIAFPGGKGTADMCVRTVERGFCLSRQGWAQSLPDLHHSHLEEKKDEPPVIRRDDAASSDRAVKKKHLPKKASRVRDRGRKQAHPRNRTQRSSDR